MTDEHVSQLERYRSVTPFAVPLMWLQRIRIGWVIVFVILAAAAALLVWKKLGSESERRDDLWRLVHDVCSSDQRLLNHSSPCLLVDKVRGFALVRGLLGSDELLLVPIQRVTGIEDPILLSPETPNYWAFAWDVRHNLKDGDRQIPDDWIGLAVNSELERTQDQLHIHIDCVSAAVRRALHATSPVPSRWSVFVPEPKHRFQETFLPEAELNRRSPFALLAKVAGHDPNRMGLQTLVLVGGANGPTGPGFYLLRQAYQSQARSPAHGEELLDHSCSDAGAR